MEHFDNALKQGASVARAMLGEREAADDVHWIWSDQYYYYNERGEKTATVDALGYLTTFKYDAEGNLSETTEYAKALTSGSWSTATYGTPTVTVPSTTVTVPNVPVCDA